MWYDMAFVHLSGKTHVNADALCRDMVQPCKPLIKSIHIEALPCGGCRYCRRAHERWQYFNEVHDIIPLTSLFVVKEERPVGSSHQLNSAVRQALASGPVDLDLRLADDRLPNLHLPVIQDESMEPRSKIDNHSAWQQGSRRGGVWSEWQIAVPL